LLHCHLACFIAEENDDDVNQSEEAAPDLKTYVCWCYSERRVYSIASFQLSCRTQSSGV